MNTEKVTNHIVNWLKNYANTANVKGFVIGISGGIDSPVAAFMMARRGCEVVALHFGTPIDDIIKKLENYSVHKIKTYNIEQENFNEILDYGFTAKVEQDFDDIANGAEKWKETLKSFYDHFRRSEYLPTRIGKHSGQPSESYGYCSLRSAK